MLKDSSFNKHHLLNLSKIFDGISNDLQKHFLQQCRIIHIGTSESLFKQGDFDKIMYVVLSGRFRVTAEKDDGLHILGDIAEGEPIGEFSLFNNEPRMATVYAMRPSVVMEISEKNYYDIISKHPEFGLKLTKVLLKRIESNFLKSHLQTSPKNIAVINLQPDHDISPWTTSVEKEFEDKKVKFNLFDLGHHAEENYDKIFEAVENSDGFNILLCDNDDTDWTQKCLLYADLIILATDFDAESHIYEIEKRFDLYSHNILNKKIYLLLLHSENAEQPKNTARWFNGRKVDLHIHFRKNNERDISRFCRIITNNAVGLVLGGGGAKGFAHIGAVKAILDEGIPIDFLGGTSAGALYGFGISYFDFDYHEINHHTELAAKKKLTSNDLTFPFISILSGRKMGNHLKNLLGDIHIEDFWISTYCVSSNFTTAAISVHRSGLAWKKILASIAIPGVFPPVIIDKELHVDGGVMDNLPIESMYAFPVSKVISVALSGASEKQLDLNEMPSALSIFWDKILHKKRYKLPGLTSIIINSLTLNSTLRQKQNRYEASLYIELDLKGVSFMDDSKWRDIVKKGYDQMNHFLENLNHQDKFWKSDLSIVESPIDLHGNK